MLQKQFKDHLIILKRFTINENDLLLTVFGRFSGKIQIKAKGSKKILSKFTGRLEPLSIIEAEIYNSGKSYTLTTANLKFCPVENLTNYDKYELSQKICNILNKVLPFEESNPPIFNLIEVITTEFKQQNISKTELYFLTKFLDFSGFLPSFTFCSTCHKKFEQNPYANQELNFYCASCIPKNNSIEALEQFEEINLNTLKLLNFISYCKKPEDLKKLKIPIYNNQQAKKILTKLTSYLTS